MTWRVWVMLMGGLLGFSPAHADELCPRPLKVGWDEWPPFHYRGPDNRPVGTAIATVTEAARRVGCPLDFEYFPWPRVLRYLESGDLDVGLEAMPLPSREKFVTFSTPYHRSTIRLWILRDAHSPTYSDLKSLLSAGQRIGAVQDYSYGAQADAELAEGVRRGQVEYVRSTEQNLQKLLDGRMLGFLGEEQAVNRFLDGQPKAKPIGPMPGFALYNDASLMFSRKSVGVDLVHRFNDALEAMRQDGTLARLQEYPAPQQAARD